MHLSRNPALLCLHHALLSTIFPVAIFPLFWVDELHMSITTMLTVQAFFGLVIALFEFPSGYVADRLGHRAALVSGTAIVLAGWALYVVAHSLVSVIVAEGVLGVGYSLISGADSALLYESLRQRGEEHAFGRWYARLRFLGQVAEGTASLAAGWLYARAARLPFQLEVGVWVLALVAALTLAPAASLAPKVERHLDQMRFIARHVLRERPDLRAVMLTAVCFSLMSFMPVWLMALYAREAGMHPAWLGPFWAGANYVVALGSFVSDRVGRRVGLITTLSGCVGLAAVAYAGLGLSHAVYGAFFYYGITFVRGLHAPQLHHEEQRMIPSSDRAGFLSFRNFLFRGAFVALGPVIGLAVERYGQHAVLLSIGACIVLAMWLCIRTLRRRLPAEPAAHAVFS